MKSENRLTSARDILEAQLKEMPADLLANAAAEMKAVTIDELAQLHQGSLDLAKIGAISEGEANWLCDKFGNGNPDLEVWSNLPFIDKVLAMHVFVDFAVIEDERHKKAIKEAAAQPAQ